MIHLAKLPNLVEDFKKMYPNTMLELYWCKKCSQEYKKLIEWSIMETFDGLGAKYDTQLRPKDLEKIVKKLNKLFCY